MTLKEFNTRKIDGKYTPMDGDYIRAFFEKHRELVLVTDKIADYKLLAETFPFKERMIVEVFSVNAYHRAKGEGFTYAALYVDTPEKLSAAKQLELKFITTHTSMYKKFQTDFEALHRAGAVIMLFVVNNPETIKIMPAGLYYTDWINPTPLYQYFHKYQ
jgi:hypothetical protein